MEGKIQNLETLEEENVNKNAYEPTNLKKLWVDIINGNRNPDNVMDMEFVAPKMVNGEINIQIEAVDIECEVKF